MIAQKERSLVSKCQKFNSKNVRNQHVRIIAKDIFKYLL